MQECCEELDGNLLEKGKYRKLRNVADGNILLQVIRSYQVTDTCKMHLN